MSDVSKASLGAAPRDPAWRATVGALLLLSLIGLWALQPDLFGGVWVLAGFTVIVLGGGALAAFIANWRSIAKALTPTAIKAAAVVLIAAIACRWLLRIGFGGYVLATVSAVLGSVLIGSEVRAQGDSRRSLLSLRGWRAIVRREVPPVGAAREIAGIVLLAISVVTFGVFVGSLGGVNTQLVFLLALVAAGVAFAISVSLLARRLGANGNGQVALDDMISRQTVSAHLHDSVLQTLALIQRKADDPEAVSRLARRQEASLRQWLSGAGEEDAASVAAALREAFEQVEDEESIVIDATIMGNRSMDAQCDALVCAVREALRNAARHSGAGTISLYAEINPRGVEAYVRDDGVGFDQRSVAPERRGVRDSIVARMESVGGWARVQSAPGAGTEVQIATRRPGGEG